ncbi:hypothetical protein [Thiorhodovibrio frisius]|uniref:Glycosyl hydrolase catalytic core n=1 Tax=Thiorhodovibrio frisius TaxID=631362 RepID=H8YYD6_9GAMM|nr:hypothetical protein [Thiorhodovibrio frisius]EIC23462.1 hypothetical protein Thi970DRAFT_01131 [Thiorhodovibrio frisius]WPL23454.1 Alpha-L-arabinofuranosidase [Thiorhodovibrio frisius]
MSISSRFLSQSAAFITFCGLLGSQSLLGADQLSLRGGDEVAIPVNKNKFGVNGEILWASSHFRNNEVANTIESSAIKFIRFPGGNLGNYYLAETGLFGCNKPLGADIQESIDKYNNSAKINSPAENDQDEYSLSDFLAVVENSRLSYSYVLNIACEEEQKTLDLLRRLKAERSSPALIELGNELYYDRWKFLVPDAKAYSEIVAEIAPKIRAELPDTKIGLLVSALNFNANSLPNADGTPPDWWSTDDTAFDNFAADFELADGLVVHWYSQAQTGWDGTDLMSHQTAFERSFDYFQARFKLAVNYLTALGDEKKDIWVTEWGVSGTKIESNFEQSSFAALFASAGLLNMLLEPSIGYANYHSLLWMTDDVKSFYAADAFQTIFGLLGEASGVKEGVSANVMPLEAVITTGAEADSESHRVLAATFIKAASENHDVVVLNGDATPYSLASYDFTDSKPRTIVRQRTVLVIGSGVRVVDETPKSLSDVEIAPYSLTLLELKNENSLSSPSSLRLVN